LAHVVSTGILAPEQIYNPENQRERDAEHDASDDRKVEAAIFALIGDIAGKASEAKWQSSAEKEKSSDDCESDSANEQQLPEFARRFHSYQPWVFYSN
jgi:hypothetical protein